VPDNGLRAYGFHADDKREATRALRPRIAEEEVIEGFRADDLTGQNPETVARRYLGNAFSSAAFPALTLPGVEGQNSEFNLLGVDESALKKTKTVRFRQSLNDIPVYGSLVTVELDAANELVCLHSALGEPKGVSSLPTLAPADALEAVQRYSGYQGEARPAPQLSYYYQPEQQRWRLVYIAEDVLCPADTRIEPTIAPRPPFADFVIDAHDGQLVDVLPRVCAATVTALDAMNQERQFETSFDVVTAGQQMQDSTHNIQTHDFAFQDAGASFNNLPGNYVTAPPLPWNQAAVSAHANAAVVANFLSAVLGRHGLDDRGGPLVSSIDCVWAANGSSGRHWPNSYWMKDQVLYGQRQSGGQSRSFAAALDMVGHEFFHGVTQYSSRFDFQGQTGALNESYSDIFGVLIANRPKPNWAQWRWEIGTDTGEPLRDMEQPSRFGHPEHMDQYQSLPLDNDSGGIHSNCGIHNKAAFNIMTSTDEQGRYLFVPPLMAQIFYHSLIVLGPTAVFSDSRRMVELQARTILRNDPQIDLKLSAITDGFTAVGII
jgi:Zn-dependent metalloprotease